jgi:PKD repeat protein
MGRRIILIIGATVLLAGLLIAISSCENPLLGTVKQIYTSFHSKLIQANFSSPDARFQADPILGVSVQFTDQSIGNITSYLWDFGDPLGPDPDPQENLPNPSHTYYAEGYYNVSLTVSGPDGESTETKENFVAAFGSEPLVDIYEPNDGDWVTGTVEIQATADFGDPITWVAFSIGGAGPFYDSTAPYSYSWETSGELQNTSIALTATANSSGLTGTDQTPQSVKVDNTAPTVDLIAPSAGGVAGNVTLTATLTDSYSGPDKVEFYVDGNRRDTDTDPGPYSYTWDARYYSEDSSHTLLARGFDDVGLSADDSTTVTIDNLGDYSPQKLHEVRIDGINNKISVEASLVHPVVLVAYEDTSDGIIWLMVSKDNGDSFTGPIEVVSNAAYPPTNPVVAYEPENKYIYLAFIQDANRDGRKDIVILRSEIEPIDVTVFQVIEDKAPTGLALDVRGQYIGLLFDARGDLYIGCSKGLDGPLAWKDPIASDLYPRDFSLAVSLDGLAYMSFVSKTDLLLFTTANLSDGSRDSDIQKLATEVRGYSSVALSPNGELVGVGFADRYANPMVLLAERAALEFKSAEHIADSRDCAYTSLTLGNKRMHLAYNSESKGLCLAASQDGKNWINYPLQDGLFAYVSMAAGFEGLVQHIGCYDKDRRQVMFVAVPFNW